MRLWYLSHRWPAKAQASLQIRAVSPEPSLFAHIKYGSRWSVRPKVKHLAPLESCASVFEEWVYAIISWAGSIFITFSSLCVPGKSCRLNEERLSCQCATWDSHHKCFAFPDTCIRCHFQGRSLKFVFNWAATRQNQQYGMCTQRRLRSAWAPDQSDQSLRCPHEETLSHWLPIERIAKTLIRLDVLAGRIVILLVLSWGGSNHSYTLKTKESQ